MTPKLPRWEYKVRDSQQYVVEHTSAGSREFGPLESFADANALIDARKRALSRPDGGK